MATLSDFSTSSSPSKLKFGTLLALVVGSTLSGGVFHLPQNIARSAGGIAILIGWIITGIGMLMLCYVYQTLALRKPNLDNGIYAYARASAGEFVGFNSAWGYWVSVWLGKVSAFIAVFAGLAYFFPFFNGGTTPQAIGSASLILWMVHAFILRGIKSVMWLNIITTILKIIVLLCFIFLTSISFQLGIFESNFWGHSTSISIFQQIKSTMLITVWLFIGIEAASVYSARAQRRNDIGRATLIGFLITFLLLMGVSLLPLGILLQPELAQLNNPSMVGVLEKITGSWGAIIIIIGLFVSVFGVLLSWDLLAAEMLFTPAKEGLLPKFLTKENSEGVPINALWLTNGSIQIFLLITLFSKATYLTSVLLATAMILVPYLFSAVYAAKIVLQGEGYEAHSYLRYKDGMISMVAVIYCCWLLYAAGLKYLLLSTLLYLPGALFYIIAKYQQAKPIFQLGGKIILSVMLLIAAVAIYLLGIGRLTLSA